jgi:hypothetical protein
MDLILKVTQHWFSQGWDNILELCFRSIICNICVLGVFLRVLYFSKEFRNWLEIQNSLTIFVKPPSYDIFMC